MRQIALSMTSAFLILLLTAVADAADVKLDVPDDVIFEKGIEYTNAGGEHLALDLARPKTPQGLSAAILCIHGGGFRAGKREHHDQLCIRLAQGGYVAATVTYRLAPSSRVSCVVDVYGPSDFTKSYGKSIDAAEVLPVFLGGDLQSARHQHILASPLYWVTPTAAPTLAIHGTQDKYVAFEQAQWLVDRLRAADVEAELLSMEGAGHGFNGEDANRAQDAMLAFFDKHLKPR